MHFPFRSFIIETYTTTIKDHKFEPTELTIPADTKVKLRPRNPDARAEGFESDEMHREKIIRSNSKAVIFIGPLKTGSYPLFGEFNPKMAQDRTQVIAGKGRR